MTTPKQYIEEFEERFGETQIFTINDKKGTLKNIYIYENIYIYDSIKSFIISTIISVLKEQKDIVEVKVKSHVTQWSSKKEVQLSTDTSENYVEGYNRAIYDVCNCLESQIKYWQELLNNK